MRGIDLEEGDFSNANLNDVVTSSSKESLSPEIRNVIGQHELWSSSGGAEGTRANLSGLDLRNVDFSGSSLSGAGFPKANLFGANFMQCELMFSDFSNAELFRSNFSLSDLRGVNFRNAILRPAMFRNTVFSPIELRDGSGHSTGRSWASSLAGADLWCGPHRCRPERGRSYRCQSHARETTACGSLHIYS